MGNRREKYSQISKHVFNEFHRTREMGLTVHDRDIKLWALNKTGEVNLTEFKASDTWVKEFKRLNKITSRRITKFVTAVNMKNIEIIEREATAVIVEMEEFITQSHVNHSQCFNIDESGINYELHSARTLSFRGEKDTQAIMASANAMTH